MDIPSKLPNVGTTIFTVMSQLALRHGAANLGQGFPDFEGPPELFEALARHVSGGRNQYAPMTGVPTLTGVTVTPSGGATRSDWPTEIWSGSLRLFHAATSAKL